MKKYVCEPQRNEIISLYLLEKIKAEHYDRRTIRSDEAHIQL